MKKILLVLVFVLFYNSFAQQINVKKVSGGYFFDTLSYKNLYLGIVLKDSLIKNYKELALINNSLLINKNREIDALKSVCVNKDAIIKEEQELNKNLIMLNKKIVARRKVLVGVGIGIGFLFGVLIN